jgi:rfaE bifunctional protein nucleotidyltransferase chain/domain
MQYSTREQALTQIQTWQKQGLKVGFTSGVFDLMHVGHLDYLSKSKKVCDRLVVAVNSDASVRRNKGPQRPIVPAEQRAELISGLKPVDLAFVFEERNNNLNIEILKPDVYIKAGDYDISRLSSAPIVKAYGGSIELIPLVNSTSTSQTIETVLSRSATCLSAPTPKPRPAVFLDRDGVINKDIGYCHQPEQFQLLPGVLEGLKKLSDANYALILVTNQAGIGLGYFKHEDFFQVNRAMFRAIAPSGAGLDKIFYCPHGINDECRCRKPKAGMIERGFEELELIRESSWMVGDLVTDVEAGKAAGLKTIRLAEHEKESDTKAHFLAQSLEQAADHILAASKL